MELEAHIVSMAVSRELGPQAASRPRPPNVGGAPKPPTGWPATARQVRLLDSDSRGRGRSNGGRRPRNARAPRPNARLGARAWPRQSRRQAAYRAFADRVLRLIRGTRKGILDSHEPIAAALLLAAPPRPTPPPGPLDAAAPGAAFDVAPAFAVADPVRPEWDGEAPARAGGPAGTPAPTAPAAPASVRPSLRFSGGHIGLYPEATSSWAPAAAAAAARAGAVVLLRRGHRHPKTGKPPSSGWAREMVEAPCSRTGGRRFGRRHRHALRPDAAHRQPLYCGTRPAWTTCAAAPCASAASTSR